MSATLEMLAAVQKIIDCARERHEGIPEVTVVLGAPGHSKKTQIHGWFARDAWKNDDGGSFHEMMLSGESLKRGAVDTLGTVLHELAHAYCHENDIKDTSNGHRYHNTKFKDVAESFGLEITKAPTIGWSVTKVRPATEEQYAEEIKNLEKALTQYRVPRFELGASSKQVKRFMYCPDCQDRLPVTKGWFERNSHLLYCGDHDTLFEMEEVHPE